MWSGRLVKKKVWQYDIFLEFSRIYKTNHRNNSKAYLIGFTEQLLMPWQFKKIWATLAALSKEKRHKNLFYHCEDCNNLLDEAIQLRLNSLEWTKELISE